MSVLSKRNLSVFLFLILAYGVYVNAYNLLYIPEEGRQIELAGGEIYKPNRYYRSVYRFGEKFREHCRELVLA